MLGIYLIDWYFWDTPVPRPAPRKENKLDVVRISKHICLYTIYICFWDVGMGQYI